MSLLEQFLASPCQEVFMQLTKQDLLQLAKHYNLSDVKISLKKQRICNILVEYLIQQEIFDDTASALIEEEDDDNDAKIAALKYQFEMQKLKLQGEREQKEREMELEKLRLERERDGIREVEIGKGI